MRYVRFLAKNIKIILAGLPKYQNLIVLCCHSCRYIKAMLLAAEAMLLALKVMLLHAEVMLLQQFSFS